MWTFAKVAAVGAVLFFGVTRGYDTWQHSPRLKIVSVAFVGANPPDLRQVLSISTEMNILALRPGALEKRALERYPELEQVSVRRHLDRTVSVESVYRSPLLVAKVNGVTMGVDKAGVVFPVDTRIRVDANMPMMIGEPTANALSRAAAGLHSLSVHLPEFYALIKFLKTDRMQPLRIQLQNDSAIQWGEMEERNAVERGKKVLALLERFEPNRLGASMKFVDEDRIVIDASWKKKQK